MKYIKDSYKYHSKLYNILLIIVSVSISLGFIIALNLDKNSLNNIYDLFIINICKYTLSNFIYPTTIYLGIFILSLTIIGYFIPFLAFSIENISIGLLLGVLIRINAFKGFIFGIIYFILTKLLYLVILIYLIINIHKFIIKIINSIKNKTNYNIHNLYLNIILKVIAAITLITIYNLILMIFISKIVSIFSFLIQ